MWTWNFWKQALERAIKTAAQVAAALLGVSGLGILDVNWKSVGSIVALAVVASLLTSIGTAGVGQTDSPSAVVVTPGATPAAAAPAVPKPAPAADNVATNTADEAPAAAD